VQKLQNKESKTGFFQMHRYSIVTSDSSTTITQKNIREFLAYQADSHASPSPKQEVKKGKTTQGICGLPLCELSKSSDQKLFSWKMCRDLFRSDISKSFFKDYLKSGIMQNGKCYRRQIVGRGTRGKGCGYWPTPNTLDSLPPKSKTALLKEFSETRKGRCQPANLRDCVSNMQNWPTPRAFMHFDARRKKGAPNVNIEDVVYAIHPDNKDKKLNPDWTEWLMGLPIAWTSLKRMIKPAWPSWETDPGEQKDSQIPRLCIEKENRKERLKGIGNAQVPQCMSEAFKILSTKN